MTIFKSLMLGTALVAASFSTAAAEVRDVSEIDVVVQFSSVGSNALQFYPSLETDLEKKLGEALEPVMNEKGGRLTVFIIGVTVDGSKILPQSGAFNTLDGGVQYLPPNPDQTSNASAMSLRTTDIRVVGVADMNQAVDASGPAYLILPSDETVYNAMLERFADVVAERLPDM